MAQGISGRLTGGRELPYLSQKDPYAGSILQRIINAVNMLAKNAAVSPLGKLSPPPPIDGQQVQGTFNSATNTLTCPSEHLHFTITHNQAIQKGVQYVHEISTEPNFLQPHVVDSGCSRSVFIHLPTFQSDGKTVQPYYLRSLPQYPGSDPQKHTTFGGANAPTKIVMTGLSGSTLLPSTGSGTASTSGQQGGRGLGTVLNRPAPGPKRSTV